MIHRIIVVEDDVLVGFDLKEQLAEAGYDAVGPFLSCGEAKAEFASSGCDAAVLDVNLGRETSVSFAMVLHGKSVPFVVLSGYSVAQLPPDLMGAPSLTKPVNIDDLIDLLEQMLQG